MGFLGKFVSVIGVLHGSLGMRSLRGRIALFIVLGSGAMRLRGFFVHLRGFAVKFVSGFSVL